ncbi:uncharacterized protein G2W53_006180 [Senna tora]|uniref:Uncharacterized protein n=1 Tax=Senna tora TaxID=362788 RepID=A0A834X377_9FABA|nr:uncharacterized protein G2W53_006180 [Senna tora]
MRVERKAGVVTCRRAEASLWPLEFGGTHVPHPQKQKGPCSHIHNRFPVKFARRGEVWVPPAVLVAINALRNHRRAYASVGIDKCRSSSKVGNLPYPSCCPNSQPFK